MENAVKNLSDALKIKTVSNRDAKKVDWKEFDRFLKFLDSNYKNVSSTCEKRIINKYSPVYIWRCKRGNKKKPVLLIGHYDVVPVEESTEGAWLKEPFSGEIDDNFIWGRGAIDDKNAVIGLMEALDSLIAAGVEPNERDIYFAFGFDEEVGGTMGAKEIARAFELEKIEFEFVLDEGGCIVYDMLEGLGNPVALIGIAEKGSSNIRITCESAGGHSSMPGRNTAIGKLSRIINNIEKNPMPDRLTITAEEMFKALAVNLPKQKRIFSNIDKLFPVIKGKLSKISALNALIRTTIAFTQIEGGDAPNILPKRASAIANLRLLQGDTTDQAIEHIKRVNRGIDFKIEKLLVEEPSEISDMNGKSFNILKDIIASEFRIGDILPSHEYKNRSVGIVPYLMMGSTDSRKYYNVCHAIYRFYPLYLEKELYGTMHGVNERIPVERFLKMISFYKALIKKI